jgi:hypothetical protein
MSTDPSAQWPAPAGDWSRPVTDTRAAWALILAVFSFIVPVAPAIAALIMAQSAARSLELGGRGREGLDLIRSARVLAVVHLLLAAAATVAVVVLAALGSVGSTAT